MKNRVLGLVTAIAAGMGGIVSRGVRATGRDVPELSDIFSEPRSTMWRGLGGHQASRRRVAMDKRDARKRRNRLRAKGR